MNQAEINTTWIRWLERRPLPQDAEAELLEQLETEPALKKQLLSDLDLHRQLQACGRVLPDDFSFVARMLVSFESYTPTLPAGITETGSRSAHEFVCGGQDAVIRNQPHESAASCERLDEHPVQGIRARDQVRPVLATPPPSTQGDRGLAIRLGALALCLLLMATLLWGSYNLGKHAGQPTQVKPAVSSSDSRLASEDEANNDQAVDDRALPASPAADPRVANQPAETGARESDQPNGDPWHSPSLESGQAEVAQLPDRAAVRPQDPKTLPPQRDGQWATIIKDRDAVWTSRPTRSPLSSQVYQLDTGTATIELAVGGQLTVTGPARFEMDRDAVHIEQGRVAFVLPDLSAETFFIRAGGNRIQPQGIARFAVRIEPAGSADLTVQRGELQVEPWFGQRSPTPITLTAGGADHLTISNDRGSQPGVARLVGSQGQFEGWVGYQGLVINSQHPELLDELLHRAESRFEESPELLTTEWQALVQALDVNPETPPFAPPAHRFQLPGIGKENSGELPDDFQRMQEMLQKMLERAGQPGWSFPSEISPGQFHFHFEAGGQGGQLPNLPFPGQMPQDALGVFKDLLQELQQQKQ